MAMDNRPIDAMCMDCKYYYWEDLPDIGAGECRYGPPTAVYEGRHDPYASSVFPLVGEYGWCWRFEKRC